MKPIILAAVLALFSPVQASTIPMSDVYNYQPKGKIAAVAWSSLTDEGKTLIYTQEHTKYFDPNSYDSNLEAFSYVSYDLQVVQDPNPDVQRSIDQASYLRGFMDGYALHMKPTAQAPKVSKTKTLGKALAKGMLIIGGSANPGLAASGLTGTPYIPAPNPAMMVPHPTTIMQMSPGFSNGVGQMWTVY